MKRLLFATCAAAVLALGGANYAAAHDDHDHGGHGGHRPGVRHGGFRIDLNFGYGGRHRHVHYQVFFRSCPCDPWVLQGCYDCPCAARQAAQGLRIAGYQAYIANGY
jgi:hypothetical protein